MAARGVSSKTDMVMRSQTKPRPVAVLTPLALAAQVAALVAACSSASPSGPLRPVVAASPPKDDGKAAEGGGGGSSHSAALEQLRVSDIAPRRDKQNSVTVPLPDADHWTRVRFLTVPSLVGFRYGKAHHAIVAAFVTHVDDNEAQGACSASFEHWATPWVEAFEVELDHHAPAAFPWSPPSPPPPSPRTVAIVEVDSLYAKTATLLSREAYEAAWAAYPAWEKACLVVGVAVPARDDPERAREVRDRFVEEVLPKVTVTTPSEPKERY
jgi:hypothetical protein